MRTNGNDIWRKQSGGAKVIVTDSDDIEIGGAVRVRVDDARVALAKFSKRYHIPGRNAKSNWRHGNKWKNYGHYPDQAFT